MTTVATAPRIFVVGAPRSGTSMTCQVLDALGVDFGRPLVGPNPSNPHGFWEHLTARDGVVKPFLKSIGADPWGQDPLPDRSWRPTGAQVETFRADLSHALGNAEALKCIKGLLVWRLLHEAFPDAKWVFVWRSVRDVARSCQRTSFMRHHTTIRGWEGYVRELHDRMREASEVVDGIDVRPKPESPESFRPMADFLGLEWNEDAVRRVLHPESWGQWYAAG